VVLFHQLSSTKALYETFCSPIRNTFIDYACAVCKDFSSFCLYIFHFVCISGVPRNFVRVGGGGGVQQIQLRTQDRERGCGGGSPLVKGSGGNCNLIQEISFHIVKVS